MRSTTGRRLVKWRGSSAAGCLIQSLRWRGRVRWRLRWFAGLVMSSEFDLGAVDGLRRRLNARVATLGTGDRSVPSIRPSLVLPTRHAGAVEGGRWAAFVATSRQLLDDRRFVGYDDESAAVASAWWRANGERWFVAVGPTPAAALERLLSRARAAGKLEQAGDGWVVIQ